MSDPRGEQGAKKSRFTISKPAAKTTKVEEPEKKETIEQAPPIAAPQIVLTWPRDWVAMLNQLIGQGTLKLSKELREQWRPHEEIADRPEFGYYQLLDDVLGGTMVWRFSSRPTKEMLFLNDLADRTALLTKVIMALTRHAGANIKNDENIRLQSFSRNLGSFISTAISPGGDIYVKNAINTSLYLVGIKIADLARHGVTARPSFAKKICIIETEYVLVPTPGANQISVSQLATVIYKNPFKGKYPPVSLAGLPEPPKDMDELPDAVAMPKMMSIAIESHIEIAMKANKDTGIGQQLMAHKENDPTPDHKSLTTLAKLYGAALQAKPEPVDEH